MGTGVAGIRLLLATLMFVAGTGAAAAGYPDRAVQIICVYPAGGGLDVVMRALAKKLSEMWKQPVIIDNRAGAATTLGTAVAARAAPDGYTLLSTDVSFSITAALFKNLTYDPNKDFAPIAQVNTVSNIFVVHPSVPVNSVQELIAFAKRSPNKLRYATGGSGTLPNLAMVMFARAAGIEMEQIPYRGSGGSMMSMVAGTQEAYIGALGSVLPFVNTGQLRPIAVLDNKRSKLLPDLPTIAEGGVSKVEAQSWYGLMAPAGTDRSIIDKLANDIRVASATPDVRAVIASLGNEPVELGPDEFSAFLKVDLARWAEAVAAAGAKPD